jgi:hypothetical protein
MTESADFEGIWGAILMIGAGPQLKGCVVGTPGVPRGFERIAEKDRSDPRSDPPSVYGVMAIAPLRALLVQPKFLVYPSRPAARKCANGV